MICLEGRMDDIDSFDRKLLAILAQEARQTGAQLSEQVGLSPAACLRRVQRLRQIGAIEREVAIVSPRVTGQTVTLLAMLVVAPGKPDRIDRLRRKFGALSQVTKIYHVTGDADLVLTVECTSMEAYAGFTEAHFYNDEIKSFETIVVLRTYDAAPRPAP
ncbi:Lrp/AsnC family transcriptional regulator [Rhodobacterales bacterium]|nr:Lrp/AsnC family transcriptional regulator [Rhodobacterales bacterium]